ncbi:MAG: arsenical resistance operon trans-acting repressor ArsD [Phycisphaerae bacterium]|nr:MAG: arsenical resistance operon trans-acting repressor ArsD [Phycisphaerae bacterium]
MSHVQVFDRAMCCSTGVCGPQVDPELPQFAADLEWLKGQGHSVDRFNLAHDAANFSANASVQKMLSDEGMECLPLILVDGKIVSRNDYPTRENLALWAGSKLQTKPVHTVPEGGCCDGSDCC